MVTTQHTVTEPLKSIVNTSIPRALSFSSLKFSQTRDTIKHTIWKWISVNIKPLWFCYHPLILRIFRSISSTLSHFLWPFKENWRRNIVHEKTWLWRGTYCHTIVVILTVSHTFTDRIWACEIATEKKNLKIMMPESENTTNFNRPSRISKCKFK